MPYLPCGLVSPNPYRDVRDRVPAGCPLTNRQLEVAALIARGLTYKEAAREIGVSVSAIRTHMHNAFVALGLSGHRASAMVVVLKDRGWLGLKPPEPSVDPRMTPQELVYCAAFTRLVLERTRECERMVTLAFMLLCLHTGFKPPRRRRAPDIDELLLSLAHGCLRSIPA